MKEKTLLIISGILITARRFAELFILNLGISVIITVLSIMDVLDTQNKLFTALVIGVILFMSINTIMLRQCFFDLENRNFFYITNIIAYLAFALLSIILYCNLSDELYTWMFAITKIAHFSVFNVPNFFSALLFHCIGIMATLVSPFGMSWIFADNIYDDID